MLRLSQQVGVNWNEYLPKAVVFRLDAIAFGVAMARIRAPSMRVRAILLSVGIAMIVAQLYEASPFGATIGIRASRAPGFDVTDLGFALMLPMIVLVPKPVAWINTPVRLFAAQSYGTHLTHSTLMDWVSFARGASQWGGLSSSLMATALNLILPALSWHCFEKRLLVWRPASRVPGRDVYVDEPSRRLAWCRDVETTWLERPTSPVPTSETADISSWPNLANIDRDDAVAAGSICQCLTQNSDFVIRPLRGSV